MKARCYAPSNKNTGYYQKDGIQVCEEWRNSYEKIHGRYGRTDLRKSKY